MFLAYCSKCKPTVALGLVPALPMGSKDKKGKKIEAGLPHHFVEGKRHDGTWTNVGAAAQKPGESVGQFLERLLKKVK